MAIFFSCPPAKNPMNWLSGDQKGWLAPSVPGSAWAVWESRERIQSDMPDEPIKVGPLPATNASLLPSGEMLKKAGFDSNASFSGAPTVKRTACVAAGVERRKYGTAPAMAAIATANAATQGRLFFHVGSDAVGTGIPDWEPPSEIHFSSRHRSLAVCQRSSGSLAMHVFTTRSSCSGVIGCSEAMDGGSTSRILAITLAEVFP